MELYWWLAVGVIYGGYFHFKNVKSAALDLADHYTLLANHIMLIAVVIGGCPMQLLYQVAFGVQASLMLIVLAFCKTHPEKYELKYFLIAIGYSVLWCLLRFWTYQWWSYGTGTVVYGIAYEGAIETLECWNCTFH